MPSIPCSAAIGNEHHDDHEHSEGHGPGDLGGRLAHQTATLLFGALRTGQQADRVFNQHDGAVAEHADGDGQARKRHEVERHPEEAHDEEGGEGRHRQLQRHQNRRPQVTHEEEQHQQHEHSALKERPANGAEGRRHQLVAVVEGHDLDVGRHRLPGQVELFPHPGHNVTARPAAQHEHDPGHGLSAAVAADGALADLGRELHGGHLAEQHRDVVAVGDHGVLEVLGIPHPPIATDHELFAAAFDKGAAGDAVVGRHRRRELLEREPVLAQGHRVRHHVKLADMPAEAVDPCNPRHGAEDGPQHPVLQRPQLHQIEVGAFEGVLVDLAETGGDRPETAAGAVR